MELLLNGAMTIREVNKVFQKQFPCLRLGFFKSHPLPGQHSFWDEKLPAGTVLANIVEDFIAGSVEIKTSDTVAQLEHKFLTKGFFVKLFQRSNDVWLETTQSSHLELHKQNAVCLRRFAPAYNAYTLFL